MRRIRPTGALALAPFAILVLTLSWSAAGGQATAGEQIAPLVSSIQITVERTQSPGRVALELPGPVVERLLVDYEQRGGTYVTKPRGAPGSQSVLREYLGTWGPVGSFSSTVAEGRLVLGKSVLSSGPRYMKLKSNGRVVLDLYSSCQAVPSEAPAQGLRWKASYQIVVNAHPYEIEIDATVTVSKTKPGEVDVVATYSGPFRLSKTPPRPAQKR